MKKLFTLLGILVVVSSSIAQTSEWLWARGATGPVPNGQEGLNVATDKSDNVYLVGFFSGSFIAFGEDTIQNPDPSSFIAYLVKYSSTGQVLWSRGTTGAIAVIYGVATDHDNNVYISGYMQENHGDSVVFGNLVLPTAHSVNFFLVKYDSAGTVLWAKSDTNYSHVSEGQSVTTDINGNVYITGVFSTAVTFDSTTLLDASPNGILASFITKYNTAGHLVWARSAIGQNGAIANSIATDINGNVYITGDGDSVNFGNGVNAYPATNGTGSDFFLAKYNNSGTAQWARHSDNGGTSATGNYVISDNKGHVYVTGHYASDSMVIGSLTMYNSHVGNQTFFVAQYDTSGTPLWVRGASGPATFSTGYSLAIDADGAVYVTGAFGQTDTITFDSTAIFAQKDTADPMFIVTYSNEGTLLCANALQSGGDDQNGIAVDHLGNTYIGGDFEKVDLIVGTDTLPLTGVENSFLAKYKCNYKMTAGIEPLSLPVTLTLYPDPFSTIAIVKYAVPDYTGTAQLTISDIFGRQVAAYPLDHASGEISITSAGLSSGVYLYSLVADGKAIATRKMVVEK